MNEEMRQYTCPLCGHIGAGKPNKKYTCHVCKKATMVRSSNGRLYPSHAEFNQNCSCERCRIFFGKLNKTHMDVLESDVDKPLFKRGNSVEHVKTGKVYVIIGVPSANAILEYCNLPFYVYTEESGVGPMWYRAQTVMEDGRFVRREKK